MKRVACLALAAFSLAGCTWLGGSSDSESVESAAEPSRAEAIYEAVVRRLVTRDHTYGRNAPRFDAVYILDGPVPRVSKLRRPGMRPSQPFSDELKEVLAASLQDLPPVSFVKTSREAFPNGMTRERRGRELLVLLGPISRDGTRAEVGASLWINSWAAIWLTYVLRERGDTWAVTGTTGPLAIA